MSKKKSYLLKRVYSAAKQKTGSPEWSAKSPQKQHREPPKYKKPWANNFKPDGDKQPQQFAESLRKRELEHQQLCTANERRLQLEPQAFRMSQDTEQQALSIALQREREARQLQDKSGVELNKLKEQWKHKRPRQLAVRPSEIHTLHTELANMAEKSELKATLSEKRMSIEGPWSTVEAEPESLLNTTGSCGSLSWMLPSQLATPPTGGEQTHPVYLFHTVQAVQRLSATDLIHHWLNSTRSNPRTVYQSFGRIRWTMQRLTRLTCRRMPMSRSQLRARAQQCGNTSHTIFRLDDWTNVHWRTPHSSK